MRCVAAIMIGLFFVLMFFGATLSETSPLPDGTSQQEWSLDQLLVRHDKDICNDENISLNFSDTTLSYLGENFIGSPLITCLNFKESGLEYVAKGAFRGVPNLEHLDLAGNNIDPKDLLSFGVHPNVKSLVLSEQRDTEFNRYVEVAENYPNLRYLYLRNNSIVGMIIVNENLTAENVFPQLLHFDLSHNTLQDYEFLKMLPSTLTHLYLDRNWMERLSLQNLTNLVVLTLDDNRFFSLNDLLVGMKSLKYLSLAHNRLINVDFAFGDAVELSFLNLSNNEIATIATGTFESLKNLRNLSLDSNYLSAVPTTNGTINLTTLSLRCNRIESIPADSFIDMPLLTRLLLGGNRIRELDTRSFAKLQYLRELSLANNELSYLPTEWSTGLENLRQLDLSGNRFASLKALRLSDSLSLGKIYLQYNNLEYLNANSFVGLPENVTVYLNPASEIPYAFTCSLVAIDK